MANKITRQLPSPDHDLPQNPSRYDVITNPLWFRWLGSGARHKKWRRRHNVAQSGAGAPHAALVASVALGVHSAPPEEVEPVAQMVLRVVSAPSEMALMAPVALRV